MRYTEVKYKHAVPAKRAVELLEQWRSIEQARKARYEATCLNRAIYEAHVYLRACVRYCVPMHASSSVMLHWSIVSAAAKHWLIGLGSLRDNKPVTNRTSRGVGQFATHVISTVAYFRYISKSCRSRLSVDRCDWALESFTYWIYVSAHRWRIV